MRRTDCHHARAFSYHTAGRCSYICHSHVMPKSRPALMRPAWSRLQRAGRGGCSASCRPAATVARAKHRGPSDRLYCQSSQTVPPPYSAWQLHTRRMAPCKPRVQQARSSIGVQEEHRTRWARLALCLWMHAHWRCCTHREEQRPWPLHRRTRHITNPLPLACMLSCSCVSCLDYSPQTACQLAHHG